MHVGAAALQHQQMCVSISIALTKLCSFWLSGISWTGPFTSQSEREPDMACNQSIQEEITAERVSFLFGIFKKKKDMAGEWNISI